MIIDTSALLAIALKEDDADEMLRRIEEAGSRKMSAPSYSEALISILRKKGEREVELLKALVTALGVEVVEFSEQHAELSLEAYARYGKGRDAAGLNFGDCMTYALAKQTGEPLLYKGDDFGKTDLLLV